MKKNIIRTVLGAVLLAVAGYGLYMNQTKETMSDVMLANLEALARYELPEVEIVCNRNDYTAPGQCWDVDDDCFRLGQWYTGCIFTGYQYMHCTSICNL